MNEYPRLTHYIINNRLITLSDARKEFGTIDNMRGYCESMGLSIDAIYDNGERIPVRPLNQDIKMT